MFNNPILQQLKKQYKADNKKSGDNQNQTPAIKPIKNETNNKPTNVVKSGNRTPQKPVLSQPQTTKPNTNVNHNNTALGSGFIEGVVKATDKGFGFLETDGRDSFFIPPPAMRNLIHGDRISAKIKTNGDRSQAEPIALIEPYLTRFLARVKYVNGFLNVVPDHPCIRNVIRAKSTLGKDVVLQEGDWVIANLKEHAMNTQRYHMAEVTEYITYANDPQAPWWVLLRELDLPKKCPDDLGAYPFLDEALEREDLTALPFVTIDSEKTKDMDDALYVSALPEGGWKLMVAIADPTGYIAEDTPLDAEAAHRAFSIYLPGRDIPMLPRRMSDDLCSLRENEERKVIVAEIHIKADGEVIHDNTRFMLAVIKSQGKLIYDKVSDFLEGQPTDFKPTPHVEEQIKLLEQFCVARSTYRSIHASVFRDKPDYDFVLDDNGALKEIIVVHRRIANKIVEESMIVANTCAGRFLAEHFKAGIFNIHMGIDPEKMQDTIALLKEYECPYADQETLESIAGFSAVKRWIDSTGNTYLDARLRKMQTFAEMSPVPGPHYGLGLDYYATWTSPIRKYGDMINHRLIKSFLNKNSQPKIPDDTTIEGMNLAKKNNRIAERNVKDWLYINYLKPDLEAGTIFEAEIFDISRGGCRVHLIANGASAFIPSSFICSDRTRIVSDNTTGIITIDGTKRYELSQTIKVQLARIDDDTRTIVARPAD